jgi:hypothetical protein
MLFDHRSLLDKELNQSISCLFMLMIGSGYRAIVNPIY